MPSWAGETCSDDLSQPAVAYFEVPRLSGNGDFYRIPFPNDIRTRDGHPDLTGHPTPGASLLGFDPLEPYLRAIEKENVGFGIYPTVVFRFSNSVDWNSIDNGVNPGAVQWVDITPTSPHYGYTLGWFSLANGMRTKYLCPNWLALRPPLGEPLQPGITYAVILSSSIKRPDGNFVKRSPDFSAMLEDSVPVEQALIQPHSHYKVFRDYLADKGLDKSTLLNAAVFTVGPVRDAAETMARSVDAAPAPTASSWVRCGNAPSPCPQASEDRACGQPNAKFDELHALVSLPIFQHGAAPYLEQGGQFEITGSTFTIARQEKVCLSLTIPKGIQAPEKGWPLVVFSHGTGGSFRSHVSLGIAETMANEGIAVIGIDQVQHGPRRGESTESPENLFFNFANPFAAKYNAMQGAADQLSLLRFVSMLSIDAPSSPTGSALHFDPNRFSFWGHSQGATQGALGIPYSTGIKGVVLSGHGASLLESLLSKTSPVNIAAALPFVLGDVDESFQLPGGSLHPALSLLQAWIDPADPLAHAKQMSITPPLPQTARHVFQPFGQRDTFSPGKTQLTYLIAARFGRVADDPSTVVANPNDDNELAGVGLVTGNAGNASVEGAAVTILTRRYGVDDYDGHFVAFRNQAARQDVTRFLVQSVSGQDPPTVGP
mgnify:FL=1|jgi:predicted esterase